LSAVWQTRRVIDQKTRTKWLPAGDAAGSRRMKREASLLVSGGAAAGGGGLRLNETNVTN